MFLLLKDQYYFQGDKRLFKSMQVTIQNSSERAISHLNPTESKKISSFTHRKFLISNPQSSSSNYLEHISSLRWTINSHSSLQ